MESTLPQSNRRRRKRSGAGSIISLIIMIIVSVLLWLNHQNLVDAIHYWSYQPSSAVSEIATNDTLTSNGKFLFYASQAAIEDRSTFNKECGQKETGTAILGCYTGDKIYVYDVTDQKLDGIKEVTAAHEMLHAVYERLSSSERDSVNALVEAEYQKLKSNPDYAERMAFYDRTEPGERDNELHSIIGTEVSSISPALEAHYAKYFTNRSAVVSYYGAYNSTFTNLSNQATILSKQLDTINAQIKESSDSYSADVKSLNAAIGDFNQRATNGSFASQSEFMSERQALIDRANTVTIERSVINDLIDRYNELSSQYNNIVTQSNNLYNSIDSSLAPAPKV